MAAAGAHHLGMLLHVLATSHPTYRLVDLSEYSLPMLLGHFHHPAIPLLPQHSMPLAAGVLLPCPSLFSFPLLLSTSLISLIPRPAWLLQGGRDYAPRGGALPEPER